MKKIGLSFMLVAFAFLLSAQDIEFYPHKLSLTGGVINPLGELGNDNNGGFANSGSSFGIDYTYSFSENIALTADVYGGTMSINEDAFIYGLRLNSQNNSMKRISFDDYELRSFVIGTQLKTRGKHYFYFNPFFGYASFLSPKTEYVITYTYSFQPEDIRTNISEKEATGIVYGFKMGANFALTDNIGLGLFGRYQESNFALSGTDSEMRSGYTEISERHYVVKVKALTTGISLNFLF